MYCAQRLTASMVSARFCCFISSGLIPCSTPYGINGFGTPKPRYIYANRQVLNALRHQWFRHHFRVCCFVRGIEGAQRLTASMVSALGQLTHIRHPFTVLNALRHQWFRHYSFDNNGAIHLDVLNALRHQWFRHQIDRATDRDMLNVLNALRHQWFRHADRARTIYQATRAQRLTASMVSARPYLNVPRLSIAVLNALRHQWFRHGAP